MILKRQIRAGDWVTATHIDTRSSITGQAAHDLKPIGPALLAVVLEPGKEFEINVNFWDVEVVRGNMLGGPR